MTPELQKGELLVPERSEACLLVATASQKRTCFGLPLEAMLLGIMPERTIGDSEKLGSSRANAACFFQGRLQIQSFRGCHHLFKIHALVRDFDSLARCSAGR